MGCSTGPLPSRQCIRRALRKPHVYGDFIDWLEPVFHHPSRVSGIVSDYVLMTIELGGVLSIAALLIGLFAWLRQDITRLGDRLSAVEKGQAEVRRPPGAS